MVEGKDSFSEKESQRCHVLAHLLDRLQILFCKMWYLICSFSVLVHVVSCLHLMCSSWSNKGSFKEVEAKLTTIYICVWRGDELIFQKNCFPLVCFIISIERKDSLELQIPKYQILVYKMYQN